MSSYLTVKIKEVGQSYKTAIQLLELTTTPTRELRSEVSLVIYGGRTYSDDETETKAEEKIRQNSEYGDYTILSDEVLDEIIDYYSRTIDEYKKSLDSHQAHLKYLLEILPKSDSVEIYDKIDNEIYSTRSTIGYLYEEIDLQDDLLNCWLYGVKRVLQENTPYSKEDKVYELIYFMD